MPFHVGYPIQHATLLSNRLSTAYCNMQNPRNPNLLNVPGEPELSVIGWIIHERRRKSESVWEDGIGSWVVVFFGLEMICTRINPEALMPKCYCHAYTMGEIANKLNVFLYISLYVCFCYEMHDMECQNLQKKDEILHEFGYY